MKTSIIDNREYRYSPDKPLTNKLATFLRHMPWEKGATTTDVQSAVRAFTSADTNSKTNINTKN